MKTTVAGMATIGTLVMGLLVSAACDSKQDERLSGDAERELRLKATCAEAGKKARAEWIAQYPSERFLDSPEYGYSRALKTCLYADEYIDFAPGEKVPLLGAIGSRRDRFVLDVYSGKVVLEYTEHDGKSIQEKPDAVQCRTEKKFEERKARLFGSAGR